MGAHTRVRPLAVHGTASGPARSYPASPRSGRARVHALRQRRPTECTDAPTPRWGRRRGECAAAVTGANGAARILFELESRHGRVLALFNFAVGRGLAHYPRRFRINAPAPRPGLDAIEARAGQRDTAGAVERLGSRRRPHSSCGSEPRQR
eukprot:355099-Chlamydomonas_euryale.AAC.2